MRFRWKLMILLLLIAMVPMIATASAMEAGSILPSAWKRLSITGEN